MDASTIVVLGGFLVAFLGHGFIERRFFSSELKDLRQNMDSKFETMRKNMDSKFETMRKNVDSKFETMRKDMGSEFKEVRQDIDTRFGSVHEEFKEVRKEINEVHLDVAFVKGQLTPISENRAPQQDKPVTELETSTPEAPAPEH